MFKSRILGGFECGFLPWKHADLLYLTEHTPDNAMLGHYSIAREHGLYTIRDGLPHYHNIEKRIEAAAFMKMEVIWDMRHYWPWPDNIETYCIRVAEAHNKHMGEDAPFWCCLINEPTIDSYMFTHTDINQNCKTAVDMLAILRKHIKTVKVVTSDPMTNPDEVMDGLERLAIHADVLGVNIYPHDVHRQGEEGAIKDILISVRNRFASSNQAIMISETGWDNRFNRNIHQKDKSEWAKYVVSETEAAISEGVNFVGTCFYNIKESVVWHDPTSDEFCDHGLIRKDFTLDMNFSKTLKQLRDR